MLVLPGGRMEQWIPRDALMWVSVGSGVALVIGAIAVPWIVINLPQDSFSNPRRPRWLDQQPIAIRLQFVGAEAAAFTRRRKATRS